MRSFADLPSEIARRTAGGERVVCVLLDAFGWRFLERYGDHPFLKRLAVTPLASQFPSTTTAHITTMNTGQPVERHGLYEWNVFEPAVGDVITPFRFTGPEMPLVLPPEPSFYESLPVASAVFQPSRFSPSAYDRVALRGAAIRPYEELPAALEAAGSEPCGYAYVYFDAIDATGHVCGPSSREFDETVKYALDALEAALPAFAGSTLVVTADHGQIDVAPPRILWLDEIWPKLRGELRHAPAGSARDLFLHVRNPESVAEALRTALGDGAEVLVGDELLALFALEPGPRLLERLGDVCVLPAPGWMAWLRSGNQFQARFRGHHGGRTPEESETWVGFLVS
jgi:hypothetical protein